MFISSNKESLGILKQKISNDSQTKLNARSSWQFHMVKKMPQFHEDDAGAFHTKSIFNKTSRNVWLLCVVQQCNQFEHQIELL